MNLVGKNVLVTGAGGFIGSHLTEELVKAGAKVRVFVKYKSDGSIGKLEELPDEVIEKIEIVRGDLKNSESVRKAVKDMEILFHLCALISIPYSYADPTDYVETNIIGTLNILNAAREYGIKKTIITSTSETYGTARYVPIDEEHPINTQSPYSATKASADRIAESFFKSYNLPLVIIRPFNTYGPRQSQRAIISSIISQALSSNNVKIGSLTPKRDFTYVKDIVQGFIKSAESENCFGEIINLCSNKTISMEDILKKIEKIINKKIIINQEEERIRPEKSEVFLLQGNNEKAKRLLGWEPKTGLEEGLKETLEYIRKNLDKYKIERGNI